MARPCSQAALLRSFSMKWLAIALKGSASAATIIATAMAKHAAVSAARRGRRASSRSANSRGTGRRDESAISRARRRGGRAGSLSAAIVLARAPRTAGRRLAEAFSIRGGGDAGFTLCDPAGSNARRPLSSAVSWASDSTLPSGNSWTPAVEVYQSFAWFYAANTGQIAIRQDHARIRRHLTCRRVIQVGVGELFKVGEGGVADLLEQAEVLRLARETCRRIDARGFLLVPLAKAGRHFGVCRIGQLRLDQLNLRMDQVPQLPGDVIGRRHRSLQQIRVRQVAQIHVHHVLRRLQGRLDCILPGHANSPVCE